MTDISLFIHNSSRFENDQVPRSSPTPQTELTPRPETSTPPAHHRGPYRVRSRADADQESVPIVAAAAPMVRVALLGDGRDEGPSIPESPPDDVVALGGPTDRLPAAGSPGPVKRVARLQPRTPLHLSASGDDSLESAGTRPRVVQTRPKITRNTRGDVPMGLLGGPVLQVVNPDNQAR
jgi:hypothetical protein